MRLLDSDIMIDVLRGHQPALDWLSSLGAEELALPGFVLMELMDGCTSKRQMNALRRRMAGFRLHWPTEADCNRAVDDFARAHLSHNLGLLDALIGQCAVGLGVPLCTFNLKHFGAIAGILVEQPYGRKA